MKTVARAFLAAFGWKPVGRVPDEKRFVLVAAPHTSNWDLVFLLAFGFYFGMRVHWLGKHTLFQGPLGVLLRFLGGIPVDRRAPGGVVGQAVASFAAADRWILAVPPEGTRGRCEYWKSGFYHIARSAGVPIALTFLDYGRRLGGFGPTLLPSGDVAADMDVVREFYEDVEGKYPDRFCAPRLLEEAPAACEKGAA